MALGSFLLLTTAIADDSGNDSCKGKEITVVKRYERKGDEFDEPGFCRGCPFGGIVKGSGCSCNDTKATWRQDLGVCLRNTGNNFDHAYTCGPT